MLVRKMAAMDQVNIGARVDHLQSTVDQLSAKVDSYHISLVNIVDKKRKKTSDVSIICKLTLSLSFLIFTHQ